MLGAQFLVLGRGMKAEQPGAGPMTFGTQRAAGLVFRIVEWCGVVKVRSVSGTERRVEIGAAQSGSAEKSSGAGGTVQRF